MNEIAGYRIVEEVFVSPETLVFRGQSIDSETVIIKTITEKFLNNESLASFNSEYSINSFFDSPLIAKTIKFTNHNNLPVIVLKDIGAQSLKKFLDDNPGYFLKNFEEGIQLAISIIKGISEIHDRNVIHKDINPSNIVYNPEIKGLNIIDFGLSSELSFENFDLSNINQLEGSLAYISPEQTGRINRNIDYRTDYYSYGITLYELFLGHLPFNASNAREWVHCQIAREAIPMHMIQKNVPKTLSKIVAKLMEKTAERRYQSPFGIISDLTKCLEEYKSDSTFTDFVPGINDISRKFQISQKLYGRDSEIELMLSAFEHLPLYNSMFVSVKGLPGSGKSSLVGELYKVITEREGYFISGKFEQFKRDTPYFAFVTAFTKLFQIILTEEEASIKQWQEKLAIALEGNAHVIIELLPELELLIGPQPLPAKLSAIDAKARFVLTFQKLVDTFADVNHPLVLFMDDLQWADQASLDLLKTLLKVHKNRAFMVIGAYRHNELPAAHPLHDKLKAIQAADIKLLEIETKELSVDVICELVEDTFYSEYEKAYELASVCFSKTLGNPFFLNAFLSNLYRTGIIKYSTEKGIWDWNIKEVEKSSVTNNVIDLICDRILDLPEETQQALKLASCVGSEFSVEILSIISETDKKKLVLALKKALNESLVLPVNESYRFAEFETSPEIDYKFFHDRVLQATYSLIDDSEKERVHHRIARLLFKSFSEEEIIENIFILIEHYNKAVKIINENERIDLSRLNLIAAKKAKSSSAFQQAYNYLKIGISLINPNSWETNYHHMLEIHSLMAEMAFLNQEKETMYRMINEVKLNAKTTLDQADTFETYLFALSFDHQYLKAIKEGVKFLKKLHVTIPEKAKPGNLLILLLKTYFSLKMIKQEELLGLPKISNHEVQAALRIMGMLITPSYYANPLLFPVLAFKFVLLTLKYGLSPISPLGFIIYGMISNTVRKSINIGYKFGQLGITMLSMVDDRRYWANTSCIYHATLCFWKEPIEHSTEGFMEDYRIALDTGNIEYATTSVAICISYLIFEGESLNELYLRYNDYETFLQQWPQQPNTNLLKAFLQTVIHLKTENERPEILIGEKINEENMIAEALEVKDYSQLASLFVNKFMLAFLFENYEEAQKIADKLGKWINNITNLLQYPIFLYYRSLLHLSLFHSYSPKQKFFAWQKIKTTRRKLKKWARYTPTNFTNKYVLIEAEIARVRGKVEKSLRYYSEAINLSKEKGNLFDEAIAYELLGKYFLRLGNYDSAEIHFKKAALTYEIWGANAKVNHLTKKYINELTAKSTYFTTGTESIKGSSTFDIKSSVDIETLMEAANTISGEVVLAELIKKITGIMLQHAGAQKGMLLLKDKLSGELEIKAEGTVEQNKQNIVLVNEKISDEKLPLSLIRLAINKKETIIVANAIHDIDFLRDNYVQRRQLKSALVLPIIQMSDIQGIMYLENNLATNVFTSHHLAVLNMLSSQVGISIENAFLYENLELKVAERTDQIKNQAEELMKANEKLIEMDKFKAGMTGMIVHDLKNPLNTILSVSDEPEVIYAGNRMMNMVLNILDIQKFESAQVRIHPVAFSLRVCANEALQQLKFLYERKSLVVQNYIPENAYAKGDFDLITRVFVNLLSNAIKFSKNNSAIQINYKNYFQDAENDIHKEDFCLVEVIDHGEGIPPENLSSIFDKFYQVQAKHSGNVRSTGLGLAYCKMAVGAHGGTISVESELGRGSRFSISLPKGKSVIKEQPQIVKEVGGGYHLSETDKNYLRGFISELSKYSVYEFSDVAGVLEKIENKSEDIIHWKDELENVLRACNVDRYEAMIKL
jgi:histidine kinase